MPTKIKTRSAWLFLVLIVLLNGLQSAHSGQEFTLIKHDNMVQSSGKIKELTVKTMPECFKQCLSECRCSAFDMREISNTNDFSCYLRPYRNESDASRLALFPGYSHFDIKQEPKEHCDAFQHCRSSVNCCLTSNPCSNGGTCTPTDSIRARFKCACPVQFKGRYCTKCAIPGYSGRNCSTKITSCRGYANGSRIPQTYIIRDTENEAVRVFCDFDKDSNITWSLIQSYSIKNAKTHEQPFWIDLGKNMEDPFANWFSYRLTKARMQSIQNDSTKWRFTCDFDKNLQAIETDSMRGSNTDLDIITFEGFQECKKVEYINIRGYSCSNCTVVFYQKAGYPLHTDSKRSQEYCEFRANTAHSCNAAGGEDNFGFYHCKNPQHRCSTTINSTTQTWLGG